MISTPISKARTYLTELKQLILTRANKDRKEERAPLSGGAVLRQGGGLRLDLRLSPVELLDRRPRWPLTRQRTKDLFELLTTIEETRFHGTYRATDSPGNFLDRVVLQIVQANDNALLV